MNTSTPGAADELSLSSGDHMILSVGKVNSEALAAVELVLIGRDDLLSQLRLARLSAVRA
jgi:hypothetical protein